MSKELAEWNLLKECLDSIPLEDIEKSLKALEIIKEKDVDIYILRKCKTVDEYNSKIVHIVGEIRELTEDEFNLLKETLK